MISVVIPTIDGREESLERAVCAYEETLGDVPHEIVVIRNERNWPSACNVGYTVAEGDVLHFSADDLEPVAGWHEEALSWLEAHDELPAPRVFNYSLEGVWDNEEDGPDGALTRFTRVPLMRRDQYERIGSWPDIDYYSDVWLSDRGRILGIETRMIHSYTFIHYWSQIGRLDSLENVERARLEYERLVAEMG